MHENHLPTKLFTPQHAKTIIEQLYIQAEQLDDEALGKITRLLLAAEKNNLQTIHIVFDRSFASSLRHGFRKEPLKLKNSTCVRNKRECLNNHESFMHRYLTLTRLSCMTSTRPISTAYWKPTQRTVPTSEKKSKKHFRN